MTENIGVRLRFEDVWIVVLPSVTDEYTIQVLDVLGRHCADADKMERALRFLNRELSKLRTQAWNMLGELIDRSRGDT